MAAKANHKTHANDLMDAMAEKKNSRYYRIYSTISRAIFTQIKTEVN